MYVSFYRHILTHKHTHTADPLSEMKNISNLIRTNVAPTHLYPFGFVISGV